MPDDFPIERLGKFGMVQGGFAFKSGDFKTSGTPVLKIKNIRLREVDTTEVAYVAPAVAHSAARYFCRFGDLLISMTGSGPQAPNSVVGRVARFTGPSNTYLINQRVGRFAINDDARLDPRFLFYVLTQTEYRWSLVSIATGSANQANISGAQIESLEIPVPSLGQQRAIGHILGSLDDKIELNRRVNETLEALARALFKSWFVDFDGTDPKGGRDGRVEALLTLSRDTINPSSYLDERFEHYSIPAFDEGREPKTELGGEIRSNKFLVPQNAVLISKLNPRFPRVWLPSASDTCRPICSTEFLVAIPREGVSREYLYGLFTSSDFSEVFASLVTGTSGSHQRVKPDYLLGIEVVIPPRETIRRYTEFAKPLHERIALNSNECRTLAGLRDTLLPKLISGELRVKGGERLMKDTL